MTAETSTPKAGVPNIREILKRKTTRAAFGTIPTGVDGYSMRHEKDSIPDLTASAAGLLAVDASHIFSLRRTIADLRSQQENTEDKLKKAAKEHRGFRGIDSTAENFRLAVTPSYKLVWVPGKLKADLGSSYSAVVHEDVTAKVIVPLGLETNEGPLTSELLTRALERGLLSLGVGREAVQGMISADTNVRVDEPVLSEGIEDGRLKVSEEAVGITEDWAVKMDPLNKNT